MIDIEIIEKNLTEALESRDNNITKTYIKEQIGLDTYDRLGNYFHAISPTLENFAIICKILKVSAKG